MATPTHRFCLNIGGSHFLLNARDGGTVMDILAQAQHVDTVYGFAGQTHREMGVERHGVALNTVNGTLVSYEDYRDRRDRENAAWEAQRAAKKAAEQAAAAEATAED